MSNGLMTFLLVLHGLLTLALVAVILMQKSEGGGLTGGGSAGGLVSARGAANLLTRTTAILATLFIVSSLGLAVLAANRSKPQTIDTRLAREAPAVGPLGTPDPAAAPPAEPAPPAGDDAPPPPIVPVLPAPGGVPIAN